MKFKILALTSVILPLCLSVSARAETYTSLRERSATVNCVNCQQLASKPDILMAQADWQKFSSDEGRFTVLLPGTPSEESQTDKTEDGIPYQEHYFSVTQPNAVYFVTYSDIAGEEVNQVDPDAVLKAATEGLLSDGGKLVSNHEISLSGYPGREIQYRDSQGNLGNTRIFLVGGRLYQLVAIASNSDDIQMFFNSFELMD